MENFINVVESLQEICEIHAKLTELDQRYKDLRENIRTLVVEYTYRKFPEWYENAVGSIEDRYSGTVEVAIQGNDFVVSVQEFPENVKEEFNWDFQMPVKTHRVRIDDVENYYIDSEESL